MADLELLLPFQPFFLFFFFFTYKRYQFTGEVVGRLDNGRDTIQEPIYDTPPG